MSSGTLFDEPIKDAARARPKARTSRSKSSTGLFARVLFQSGFWESWLRRGRSRPVLLHFTDPVLGSKARANDMFQGRFTISGHVLHCLNRPPWYAAAPNPVLLAELHSFEWLRDFVAANGPAARKLARDLIRSWAVRFGRWNDLAWRPDILARRLAAWSMAAEFLLIDGEDAFVRDFQKLLTSQQRHLKVALRSAQPGTPKIEAGAGMVIVALAQIQNRVANKNLGLLGADITRHLLPDGGASSRNPEDAMRILRALVGVRAALQAASVETPEWLQQGIDRATPFVRGLSHGDGGIAVFNGAFEGDPDRNRAIIKAARMQCKPQKNAHNSGYERLVAERTLVIADANTRIPGNPPGSSGHAGALAFELSVGKDRLVVSCGTFAGDDPAWHEASRATAAHSTLVLGDENGVSDESDSERDVLHGREEDAAWIELRSDAYRERFGVEHFRRIYLADDGQEVLGEDHISVPLAQIAKAGTDISIRFHLHPQIQASLIGNSEEVLLRLANGAGWMFEAPGHQIQVEESIYLGRPGETRRSEQITLSAKMTPGGAKLIWRFARLQGAAKGSSV
jgi:uncharacterized heparinase superfamily protein